jgi:hypothetical protein
MSQLNNARVLDDTKSPENIFISSRQKRAALCDPTVCHIVGSARAVFSLDSEIVPLCWFSDIDGQICLIKLCTER